MTRNRHRPFVYTQPDHWQRVYTSRWGRAAHLLHLSCSPNDSEPAACGKRPLDSLFGWEGTGSQGEIDKVAAMPLCQECRMAVYGE